MPLTVIFIISPTSIIPQKRTEKNRKRKIKSLENIQTSNNTRKLNFLHIMKFDMFNLWMYNGIDYVI